MDLDHHVGVVADRAHERVTIDDLRLVTLGLQLLAGLRDLRGDILADRTQLGLQLLDLRGLCGGQRRGFGDDVARVLHLLKPSALAHSGQQVLRVDPTRRVHRQVHGRVRVGNHDVAAAGQAQTARQATRHAAQRLEHAVLQTNGHAVGEGLRPLPHDRAGFLLGARDRAAQDPRMRQQGRGAQLRARRLIQGPRAFKLSIRRQVQATGREPTGVVPHGDRESLQLGRIHGLRHEEQVVSQGFLHVDDARRFADLNGGGDRHGGLSAGDFAVGGNLERRLLGGVQADQGHVRLHDRAARRGRKDRVRQAGVGTRHAFLEGTSDRRRRGRRIVPVRDLTGARGHAGQHDTRYDARARRGDLLTGGRGR